MLALAKGIKLLQLKGIKDIILEGDNLLLSEALRHQGSWPWQLMVIWRKIKDLESFDRWEANFCHRQMNQVADAFLSYIHRIQQSFIMHCLHAYIVIILREFQWMTLCRLVISLLQGGIL